MSTNGAYWWSELLQKHMVKGRADADAGIYDQPYPTDNIPQDADKNDAYRFGWCERRRELGDAFRWAK
jgi:hypothetical protein